MKHALISDAEMLERIEAFCELHGMGAAAFGRASIGDPSLITNLRGTRSLTLKTANKIADFMASYEAQQADAA
ncbi:MAG: hypothetical protein ACK4ZW_08425 [Blastomonas sp.]